MNYQSDMKRIAAGLPTKSEKIRQLGQAGYSRQQIADFLGIRYQHVRNVLVDAAKKHAAKTGELAEPKPAWRAEDVSADLSGKIRIRTDGSAIIPANVLVQAGFKPGDAVVAHFEGEGEVHLLSRRAALDRARELVRRYVPKGVSLVDDLLEERRREAEHD